MSFFRRVLLRAYDFLCKETESMPGVLFELQLAGNEYNAIVGS
jgi:hypothetical protein